MENPGVQKKQTGETPSAVRTLWDPFGFMQGMFGWGRSSDAPLFEVKETDEAYVCRIKVPLTLPDQVDVGHARAQLDNGELTLVVPKPTVAAPEPVPPPQTAAAKPASPPRRRRRTKEGSPGRASAGRGSRRGARTPARRG
jgi:hypothetical protein